MTRICNICKQDKPIEDFYLTSKKKWRQRSCKICASIKSNERYHKHPNKQLIMAAMKNWNINNKDKIKKYRAKYIKSPAGKIATTLRRRIKDILKSPVSFLISKTIGCSPSELKIHLESKFKEGMTWENHAFYGWHVDHIKPISKFDLNNPEEIKKNKSLYQFTAIMVAR